MIRKIALYKINILQEDIKFMDKDEYMVTVKVNGLKHAEQIEKMLLRLEDAKVFEEY